MNSRVLLINQFFWPDTAATAQLLADLAEDLAEDGWQVTALAGSRPRRKRSGDARNTEASLLTQVRNPCYRTSAR
jgi:hypothetical protein